MRALRKNAVINFPLPSGSSPPENPPGINTICDCFRAVANCSVLLAIPLALRLLITIISGSAPASRITFALSYSQLVPGNAGISTLGLATLIEGATLSFTL